MGGVTELRSLADFRADVIGVVSPSCFSGGADTVWFTEITVSWSARQLVELVGSPDSTIFSLFSDIIIVLFKIVDESCGRSRE